MIKLFYILAVIGFLICFLGLEIWLFKKSKEKFLELKQSYKDLKNAQQNLKDL
jgi:uncharacterized membrane protein